MQHKFRNGSLLVLAMTAFASSKTMFAACRDPEGANLLVVSGMAAVVFVLSAAAYLSIVLPWLTGSKELRSLSSSRYLSRWRRTSDCAEAASANLHTGRDRADYRLCRVGLVRFFTIRCTGL